jgi:hypothetical protein
MSDKPAKHSMKTALALLLASTAVTACAQAADPLKSPACGAALAGLQAARQGGADAARVEALRSSAAGICLGSATPSARPGRVARAPEVVPPPQITVPVRPAAPAAPALPPPAVAIERPALPATCDPSGCWSSDGTHLRHVAPSVPGLAGPCVAQGGVVYCP